MDSLTVFEGSDGKLTMQYYAELMQRGPIGEVAMNLFRAQKCSERAKVYRGGLRGKGKFKDLAYERKTWSMDNLCKILAARAEELGITYGWKQDRNVLFNQQSSWVLYIDIPTGQVSFHSPSRGKGPAYESDWDGIGNSRNRILNFCDRVFRCEPTRSVVQVERTLVAETQKKEPELKPLRPFVDDGRPPWE